MGDLKDFAPVYEFLRDYQSLFAQYAAYMIGTYYWDEHSWEVPVIVFHEINGVNISCWVGSEDFSDGKKSLVFVHGSGGDHRIWIKQYTKLKDEFNIAVIDLPGHGQSEGAGEQNVSLYVEWVKMLLDSFALQKPVLIGHSLGRP